MKSKFFTDTRALDISPPGDQICVCLLMKRATYEQAVQAASRQHLTSGEYMEKLILTACGTTVLPPSDSPWQRLPQAPPDH